MVKLNFEPMDGKGGGGGFAFLKMKNESTCNGYDN